MEAFLFWVVLLTWSGQTPATCQDVLEGQNFVIFQVHDGVLGAEVNLARLHQVSPIGSTKLSWRRESCIDPSDTKKECSLPVQLLSMTVNEGETGQISLPGITYNSDFQLEITRAFDGSTYATYFSAPYCNAPDPSFTICETVKSHDMTTTPALITTKWSSLDSPVVALGLCVVLGLVVISLVLVLLCQRATLTNTLRKLKNVFLPSKERTIDVEGSRLMDRRYQSCSHLPEAAVRNIGELTRSVSLSGLNQVSSITEIFPPIFSEL